MSRALRRHHRRRIIAKHARIYREVYYWSPPAMEVLPHEMRLGCSRPRCSICHPHKRDHLDRRRAEREWRWIEGVG